MQLYTHTTVWEAAPVEWALGAAPTARCYSVSITSADSGYLEFVPGRTFAEMSAEDWTKLNVRKYASTAVGAYVSNFILGVRDRHEHNIMIVNDLEKDPKMMQIDFGFILMENPGGLALDTPRLTMPAPLVRRFQETLMEDGKTTLMDAFRQDMLSAFVALRRSQSVVISFVRTLLSSVYTTQKVEVGGASALATFIRVLCTLRMQFLL
jgi:phosphatidylinositol kinase/protein kinase (PI-3  family)